MDDHAASEIAIGSKLGIDTTRKLPRKGFKRPWPRLSEWMRGESEDGKDVSANKPDRSTAAAFPQSLSGEVMADSVALQWPGLYARRWRLPRVVDRLLVPATPEPHISCTLWGEAEFRERDVGGAWITRQIREGELFVTRSRTSYEVRFQSPPGQQLDNLSLHIAVEPFLAALEARYPGEADLAEVVDLTPTIRASECNQVTV